jgi:hypothetical protein
MTMRTSSALYSNQSRLAGFFLCWVLLTACGKSEAPAINVSMQQAQQAEKNGLLSQALPLYQQAAAAGDTAAVAAVLRLQRPEVGVAALSQWLQALPLSAEQRQPFLAELGLWHQLSAAQALQLQQQWYSATASTISGQHQKQLERDLRQGQSTTSKTTSCALYLQPVLSTKQSAIQWQQLQQQWRQDAQLSSLPLCFRAPVFIDSQLLACSEHSSKRIACNADALTTVVSQGQATQILVLAGQGGASYNNGWLQLPETANLPLLRHEISHLFGFIDEYPLSPVIASSECIAGRMTPNLLFSKDDLPAYLAKWQLNANEVQLTPVDACQHTSAQAYRVVEPDSHLQHYELAMPDLYLRLIRKQLAQPEQLMPVAYYFAYLARQQQDWRGWQQMMEIAAGFGYPAAQQALAEAGGNGLRQSVR